MTTDHDARLAASFGRRRNRRLLRRAGKADLAGSVVIVVGDDGARVGAAVAALEARGARVAAFIGDLSTPDAGDALAEMAAELFPT